MFWLSASAMFCLGKNEKESLVGLADRLHQRVVGQTEAVNTVVDGVLRSRAGLGRPQQCTSSFLFLGTSYVGKTELSKGLAEHLFNDENLVVCIDMLEYMEQYSVMLPFPFAREADADSDSYN